jgi:hypothetical protein
MSPTLEQAARAIAEQRRQEATTLFETVYAELLPALKGSATLYRVCPMPWGGFEIAFAKAGIPNLYFDLLPDGKAMNKSTGKGIEPEVLTTLLADYIVRQEDLDASEGFQKARWKRFQNWQAVVMILFLADSTVLYQFWEGVQFGEWHDIILQATSGAGLVLLIALGLMGSVKMNEQMHEQ